MKEYDPLEMQFDGDRDAKQKANRLRFHQWLFRRRPEKRQPQTPLPKSEPKRIGERKGWGKPGV